MGAGEGSAPLLSRVILRVRGDRGADSSVSPQTERTNDAAIPARPRNGMSLCGGIHTRYKCQGRSLLLPKRA